jgi:3-oxoadipate enol-lactonase
VTRLWSLSTWRDEKAVVRWRAHRRDHLAGQERGSSEIFQDYLLRVGEVTSDTHPPDGATVAQMRFDETEVGAARAVMIAEFQGAGGEPEDLMEELVHPERFERIYRPGERLLLASWRTAAGARGWDGSASAAPINAHQGQRGQPRGGRRADIAAPGRDPRRPMEKEHQRVTDLSHFITSDRCRLAYRLDGPEDAPVLALSNSIATTLRMWDGQIAALSERYRVVRYDTRGHGASDAPAGAYSFDRLGRDVIELLDVLEIETCTFCGLSFGGLIGQWLGVHAPERIERLILANTSSFLGPPEQWDQQINAVLAAEDMRPIAALFLTNWFPRDMLEQDDELVAPFRQDLLAMNPIGLAGCFAAIRDADLRRTIQLITCPTLVIAGEHDTVTLPAHGKAIADTIPGAQLVTLPVVHLSNVEKPDAFLAAVFAFMDSTHPSASHARSAKSQ